MANKPLKGEVRIRSSLGNIIVAQKFKDLYQRRSLTNKLMNKHSEKLLSGEWVLSYLIN